MLVIKLLSRPLRNAKQPQQPLLPRTSARATGRRGSKRADSRTTRINYRKWAKLRNRRRVARLTQVFLLQWRCFRTRSERWATASCGTTTSSRTSILLNRKKRLILCRICIQKQVDLSHSDLWDRVWRNGRLSLSLITLMIVREWCPLTSRRSLLSRRRGERVRGAPQKLVTTQLLRSWMISSNEQMTSSSNSPSSQHRTDTPLATSSGQEPTWSNPTQLGLKQGSQVAWAGRRRVRSDLLIMLMGGRKSRWSLKALTTLSRFSDKNGSHRRVTLRKGRWWPSTTTLLILHLISQECCLTMFHKWVWARSSQTSCRSQSDTKWLTLFSMPLFISLLNRRRRVRLRLATC